MGNLRVCDVKNIVSSEPILIRSEASIHEAVERMIDTPHARSAYVVDAQGQLVGIVTLKDLVDHIFANHYFTSTESAGTVFQIAHTENAIDMAASETVFVTQDETLEEAVQKILNHDLQEIPVIDDEGVVIGDLNLLDLLSVWLESSAAQKAERGYERVRLARHTNRGLVCLKLKSKTKEGALKEMFSLLEKTQQMKDIDMFKTLVNEREALVSTGIGKGVAIPHARCACAHGCAMAIGLSKDGVDFAALDGEPVNIIVLLAVQASPGFPYAHLLSNVMHLLHSDENKKIILSCQSAEELISLLEEYDRKEMARLREMKH